MTHLRLIALLLFATTLQAKNLDGRVGFGVTAHAFQSTTAMSVRFFPGPYLSATLYGGFTSYPDRSATTVGAKLCRNLIFEENLNFFAGMNFALLMSKDPAGPSRTGLELAALIGTEFFLSGLPNLGLLFEAGVAARSLSGLTIMTFGGSFAGAGIHYYF